MRLRELEVLENIWATSQLNIILSQNISGRKSRYLFCNDLQDTAILCTPRLTAAGVFLCAAAAEQRISARINSPWLGLHRTFSAFGGHHMTLASLAPTESLECQTSRCDTCEHRSVMSLTHSAINLTHETH